jgi:hypothetical protein
VHTIVSFDGVKPQVNISTANLAETSVTGTLVKTISKTESVSITDSWTRVQTNIYVPAEFSTSRTTAEVALVGTFTDYVQIDAVQLEPSYLATDYFDGDYGTERDALWADTPNASNSYLYPNKIINVTRLSSELVNFLPQNTPYIISSYSGIEASGFTD